MDIKWVKHCIVYDCLSVAKHFTSTTNILSLFHFTLHSAKRCFTTVKSDLSPGFIKPITSVQGVNGLVKNLFYICSPHSSKSISQLHSCYMEQVKAVACLQTCAWAGIWNIVYLKWIFILVRQDLISVLWSNLKIRMPIM